MSFYFLTVSSFSSRSLVGPWLDTGDGLPTQALDSMLLILPSDSTLPGPTHDPSQGHHFSVSITIEYSLGSHKVPDLTVCTLS